MYGGGRRYTFAALEREARTIARGLMAIGIEPGERVVLWATNVPEWVVLQFALAKIGAILVAANTSLGHFHDLLNDTDKEVVMADIMRWIDARLPAATS